MIQKTRISGINSMSIYIYNNVKYFFFGDIHGQNKNTCKGNCDYFDYHFKNTNSYDSSCTEIGPLLFNWFEYNDKHHINTGFYLEENYIKGTRYDYFRDIISKRENYNTLTTIFPYDDISWMQLTRYLLENKNYDYIDIHNVDIRYKNQENINPFSLNYININNIDSKNDIVNIIKLLLSNYQFILKSLLIGTNMNTLHDFILSKIKTSSLKKNYQNHINNNSIIYETIEKLSVKNKKVADQIVDFILLLSKEHMSHIESKFYILDDYDFIDNDEKLISLEIVVNYYKTVFTVLSAYTMDAYVLANLFLNDYPENIVYTGVAHTEVYNLFFQSTLELEAIYDHTDPDNKCIVFDDLPVYLDINKYKKI